MSDKELAQAIVEAASDISARCGGIDDADEQGKLLEKTLALLADVRAKRLEGAGERLEEIQTTEAAIEQEVKERGSTAFLTSVLLAQEVAAKYIPHARKAIPYLLALVADLRCLIHDLQQDSENYQRGVREGAAQERVAIAGMLAAEAQAGNLVFSGREAIKRIIQAIRARSGVTP